jgi:hypothetical protein
VAQVQDANPQERHSAKLIETGPVENEPVAKDTETVGAARAQHATLKRQPSELVCVHYGGRQFIATYEMAGIFLRRAQRLIDAEDAELVPLVHEDGLELLYVSSAMPFSVHNADTEPADGSHARPATSGTEPGAETPTSGYQARTEAPHPEVA